MKDRGVSLVKATRKGQVTIPQETKERLEIREADNLVATEVKDLVILRKISLPSWDGLFTYRKKFAAEKGITREDVLKALRQNRGHQLLFQHLPFLTPSNITRK